MSRNYARLVLTLSGFLVVNLFFAIILKRYDFSYFNEVCWMRYDSWHYLGIIEKGYSLMPCDHLANPKDPNTIWCGNAGWFGGYPLISYGLSFLVKNKIQALIWVSNAFRLGGIYTFLKIAKVKNINASSILLTLTSYFFFSFFYAHTAFPISMLLFFMLLAIYSVLEEKHILLVVSCFMASLSYPSGFLLAMAISLYYILIHKRDWAQLIPKVLPVIASGAVGVLVFYIYLYFSVGDFYAFVKVQSKYGHGVNHMFGFVQRLFEKLTSFKSWKELIPVLQSLFVLMGLILYSVYFFTRKVYNSKVKLLVYLVVCTFMLFPWILGGEGLSMYRAESLLLPAVLLTQDLSIAKKTAFLVLLFGLGILMYGLFVEAILI